MKKHKFFTLLTICLAVPALVLTACNTGSTVTPSTPSTDQPGDTNPNSGEPDDGEPSDGEPDDGDPDEEYIPVTGISFSGGSSFITLTVGDTYDFDDLVIISPSDATNKNYTLSSANPSVVSVSGTLITAVAEGSSINVTVTSSDNNAIAKVAYVTVKAAETTPTDPDPEPEPEPEPDPGNTDPDGHTHSYVVDLAAITSPMEFSQEKTDANGTGVTDRLDGNLYYWNSQGWSESGASVTVTANGYDSSSGQYNIGWSSTANYGWYDFQLFMKLPTSAGLAVGEYFSITTYVYPSFTGDITINGKVVSLTANQVNRVVVDSSSSAQNNAADLSIQMGVSSTNSFIQTGSLGFQYLAFDWTDSSTDDYSNLVWSDEFEGSALDTTKWAYQNGGGYGNDEPGWGWGNSELEWYQSSNVSVSNGELVITAKRDSSVDNYSYTSGRIRTYGLFGVTYGKIEARIKYDCYQGLWPAFWMLPTDIYKYGKWSSTGEIDIMEGIGRLPTWSSCALHYGPNGGDEYQSNSNITLSSAASNYHTYSVIWEENVITYYCDDVQTLRVTSDTWWSEGAPNSSTAPFDQEFYILLNLAVGGHFDGYREPEDSFTSGNMYIDYVRVYK